MFTAVWTFTRSGVMALGVVLGASAGAVSAPMGPLDKPQAGPTLPLNLVAQGEFRNGSHPVWRRGGGSWRGNGGWHRGGNWRHNGRWNGNHWHGRHGRYWNDYDNVGIGIGLGFGLPFWGGGYYPGYYDPYYAPPAYYAPRRVYRARSGSAHVRWCYARYRSYRAWDNTFQPYVGPRRQCYSPY